MGVVRTKGLTGAWVKVPGLRNRTGAWAVCHGIFSPVVCIDATLPITNGFNALVAHESYHAERRHKLKELALILLAPTIVALVVWVFFKRNIETAADKFAFKMFGDREYRAFLYLHSNPSSWWARWKYGATREARYKRVTGTSL